jgi:aspartyl-tRNA(Asn)/glutamyl-tRNA(Gln) amidotransferase subunit A
MYYETIQKLSTQLKNKEVSPVEITEVCLKRIEELNPKLNAFITVMAAEARASAAQAEEEIKNGKWRGALHGIPVAVKDFYDTKGTKTTAGFAQMKDRIADSDAEVVKKLREAGAIIVGKTNMDSLGMATTGLTSFFGPVRNPWNDEYVTGGSSAGSAAAVASGMCYATVDTDAVGSVRLPAAACGVVGFKGSYGLISTKGILGDQPAGDFILWMGHAAVTTRDIGDTALILNALAESGADFVKATSDVGPMRVGIGDNFHSDPEVMKAFTSAVKVVGDLGYEVHKANVPFGNPSQSDMSNIKKDREHIGDEAFSHVDVIVLPTMQAPTPNVKVAEKDPEQAISAEITAFANYYGLPAVSIPCGFDSHGMPIGLQIVSKPGGDANVLALADVLAPALKLSPKHPSLDS